jgi:hypothetical protein
MIQIEPKHRLGATLESISTLKLHPFFDGIDFEKVSAKKFCEIGEMLKPVLPQQKNDFLEGYLPDKR